MTSNDVVTLYLELGKLNIQVWLDGGWGVDALLEKQTRPHNDVDLVIQEKDLPLFQKFLEDKGYKNVPRDDARAWNFVLGDSKGHTIDVHVINIDVNGNGIYGPLENGVMYPSYSLQGKGTIDDLSVHCLTAEYQIESHGGYTLKAKDYSDVVAICEKFNLPLPKQFVGWDKK